MKSELVIISHYQLDDLPVKFAINLATHKLNIRPAMNYLFLNGI